jgi:ribonuclease R
MLPEKLSNGLCSLKPDVDRLAMSLTMTIQDGRVMDHRLTPSVIHSRARLTYEAVNRLFNGDENDVPPALHDTLRDMLTLSQDLRAARFKRGAIDLDIPETGFTLTPEGEPLDVHPRERGEAERLIEDFMLAANETVAELARHTDLAFVYRVHEKPDPDKLHALELFLASLNLRVHLGPEPHPGQLQDLLTKTEQSPAAGVIRQVMLRSLRRAVYSHRPDGHYALAARDYCHFTSPIRRYPDLMVHRALKSLLAGKPTSASEQEKRMAELSEQCSSQEYAATTAEREADDLLKARYMSRHIGEAFSGIVSGVTPWGFYVTLSNTVEGLVPIGTLEDYYEYDEVSSTLTGSHTGKVIRLGQRTRVRVSRVDTARREIDFTLEERG